MKQGGSNRLGRFFTRWAVSLLLVAAAAHLLDCLALQGIPSLKENPYFRGYEDVVQSFAFVGWRFLISCVLIPVFFWNFDRVPHFFRRCFLTKITIITLSDHTATELDRARQSRHAGYLAELEQYEQARKCLREHRELAIQALRSAWRDRRIWGAVRGLMAWWNAMRASPPAAPRLPGASDREQILAAGNEGEELVLNALKRRLTGTWTLAKGYKNQKGEIDLIAVGPSGIVAMEVKNLNGVVHCEGDQWKRDKYDDWGNLVERGLPIKDNGGRAPSRQVNEAADVLQDFLHRRGMPARILRVVVLSHQKSRVGHVQNQTVDRICTLHKLDLALFCRGRCTKNSAEDIEKAVSLIRQDHAYHNKGRRMSTAVGARV